MLNNKLMNEKVALVVAGATIALGLGGVVMKIVK